MPVTPLAAETAGSLDDLLTGRFGIPAFHPWQREAIDALLAPGGRVLLVAPTGGGKSLCYQLPALALPGTALVLSPLISLMEDQVRALDARGIPATFVASTLPREENARRLAGLRRGEYKIVYAAPERLVSEGFIDALSASLPSLVAIDEAHCIVQWGHDFRPDYMRIGGVLERLTRSAKGGAVPRVIACTATATPDARDEILRQLRLGDATVVLRGFARPNLHLAVEEVSGPRESHAETAAALARALGSPRAPRGAGIVYAATRKGAERLAEKLRSESWDARPYHAGQPAEVRAKLSGDFAERTVSVVVATNAFGMGIDRPDVRVVVHAQPPASIEAYYQEVGRAGRDGAPAEGLLLVAGQDIALRRRMCALGGDGPAAVADAARAWKLFRELLRYVDAATCRHDFILRYFGDEAESLGGCGHCDVCRGAEETASSDPALLARDADVFRRVLAGVARAKGGAGMQSVAAMLRGDRSDRVEKLGLDRLSTFGILEGRSQDEVMVAMRVALAAGWVDLTPTEFPVPLVTELGWRVMRGDQETRIRLPAPKTHRRRATAKGGKRRAAPSSSPPGDPKLYEALRAHRARLASASGVPAYVIASDRTLAEIAATRPSTMGQLLDVHGMGPARAEKYGEGLLRVVAGGG